MNLLHILTLLLIALVHRCAAHSTNYTYNSNLAHTLQCINLAVNETTANSTLFQQTVAVLYPSATPVTAAHCANLSSNYTVYVPTDAAIQYNLARYNITNLTAAVAAAADQARQIVLYHIVPGLINMTSGVNDVDTLATVNLTQAPANSTTVNATSLSKLLYNVGNATYNVTNSTVAVQRVVVYNVSSPDQSTTYYSNIFAQLGTNFTSLVCMLCTAVRRANS